MEAYLKELSSLLLMAEVVLLVIYLALMIGEIQHKFATRTRKICFYEGLVIYIVAIALNIFLDGIVADIVLRCSTVIVMLLVLVVEFWPAVFKFGRYKL